MKANQEPSVTLTLVNFSLKEQELLESVALIFYVEFCVMLCFKEYNHYAVSFDG